jgi:histone H3/H4
MNVENQSHLSEKYIKNSSINRLSKKAGIKTLSHDSYPIIHAILSNKIQEISEVIKSVNAEHGTKNIMPKDFQKAIEILGINMAIDRN